MILERILTSVRVELEMRKRNQPQADLYKQIDSLPAARGFQRALAVPGQVKLIAEFKQASPSKGIIRQDLTLEEVISDYSRNGAAAISILTEPKFFKGSLNYLSAARQITDIPLLRKDFIIDEYQLIEARICGADAVLLIVSALGQQELSRLLRQAQELSLDCLIEVHTKEEIEIALANGAQIIGINNRNLSTFETKLETTFELARHIPKNCIIVSESGINRKEDIERMSRCGVNAVLIGEALMRSPCPGQKLRELAGDRDWFA